MENRSALLAVVLAFVGGCLLGMVLGAWLVVPDEYKLGYELGYEAGHTDGLRQGRDEGQPWVGLIVASAVIVGLGFVWRPVWRLWRQRKDAR